MPDAEEKYMTNASLIGLFLPKALGIGSGVAKNLIPSNPVSAFAEGNMLQVLVFAIIVGITCLSVGEKAVPSGIIGVYISVNTLCDMGATCANVLGNLACSVAMKETAKIR